VFVLGVQCIIATAEREGFVATCMTSPGPATVTVS